jgi:hypothetical protein
MGLRSSRACHVLSNPQLSLMAVLLARFTGNGRRYPRSTSTGSLLAVAISSSAVRVNFPPPYRHQLTQLGLPHFIHMKCTSLASSRPFWRTVILSPRPRKNLHKRPHHESPRVASIAPGRGEHPRPVPTFSFTVAQHSRPLQTVCFWILAGIA